MRKLTDVTLRDLLPPTLRNAPDAVAESAAIAKECWRLVSLAQNAVVFAGIGQMPEAWLDAFAADMHVDFYDTTLELAQKRELVERSIEMHRRKGTAGSVEQLISIVFGGGKVEEWFEYSGEPHHFKVYVSDPLTTPEAAKNFLRALDSVKNLSSVLDEIWTFRSWQTILVRDALTWQGVQSLRDWGNVRGLLWYSGTDAQAAVAE